MFHLFPQLRTKQGNTNSVVVSQRCLKICRMLNLAGKPVKVNKLQAMLCAAGETWAQSRAGYLTVLNLVRQLREAGIVCNAGTLGINLVSDEDAMNVVIAAMATLIQESLPDFGSLAELKRDMREQVLYYPIRAKTRAKTGS